MKKIKYVNDNLTINDLGENQWEGCRASTLEFISRYNIGDEFEKFEAKSNHYIIYDNGKFQTTNDNWLCVNKKLFEIIEYNSKDEIEKIKWEKKSDFANCGNSSGDYYAMFMARTEQLKKGLNEIINVLNELKK